MPLPAFAVDMSNPRSMAAEMDQPIVAYLSEFLKAHNETKSIFTDAYTKWFTTDMEFTDPMGVIYKGEEAFTKYVEPMGMFSDFENVPSHETFYRATANGYQGIGLG